MVNYCELWWIVENCGELWWIMVNYGELRWIVVNCGELWWTVVNCGELWWIAVNCGELWWTVVNCGELWRNCGELWRFVVNCCELWWIATLFSILNVKHSTPNSARMVLFVEDCLMESNYNFTIYIVNLRQIYEEIKKNTFACSSLLGMFYPVFLVTWIYVALILEGKITGKYLMPPVIAGESTQTFTMTSLRNDFKKSFQPHCWLFFLEN